MPARPWDSVFGHADKEWWREQLGYTFFRSHGSTVTAAVDGDVPVGRSQTTGGKRAVPGGDTSGNSAGQVIQPPQPPPKPATKTNAPPKKKPKGIRQHNVENGYHNTCRDGTPLCNNYNFGRCQSAAKGFSCPVDPSRYHLCSKCLRPGHGANVCQQEVREPSKRKPKGAGEGGKTP